MHAAPRIFSFTFIQFYPLLSTFCETNWDTFFTSGLDGLGMNISKHYSAKEHRCAGIITGSIITVESVRIGLVGDQQLRMCDSAFSQRRHQKAGAGSIRRRINIARCQPANLHHSSPLRCKGPGGTTKFPQRWKLNQICWSSNVRTRPMKGGQVHWPISMLQLKRTGHS